MSHSVGDHPGTFEVVPKEKREVILHELELLLESSLFRSSKRCRQFISYSVQHVLDGEWDHLKERSIGVAIFDRPSSYDTGEDSIVRVTAKEVRSRLIQYYAGLTEEPPVKLEIAPGSYRTEFKWPAAAPHEVPAMPRTDEVVSIHPPGRRFSWRPFAVGIALLALVSSALVYRVMFPTKTSLLRQFWGPVLESSKPVLICLASPGVYRLDDKVFERFRINDPGHATVVAAALPNQAIVYGREIIPAPDDYAGIGDTIGAAHLAVLFTKFGKSLDVRKSKDISFSDLRSAPAVLIGAFTNSWTLELMKEWRFVFDVNKPPGWVIRDRNDPTRVWANPALQEELRKRNLTEDYALISRVFEQRSGQPVVSVAGITDYGTEAAAEFLSDEALLAQAFVGAPPHWEHKNIQLIIKTQVVGHTTSQPQFVARQIW
jgi:hypothetical protein